MMRSTFSACSISKLYSPTISWDYSLVPLANKNQENQLQRETFDLFIFCWLVI
jgi:hypothetical protein